MDNNSKNTLRKDMLSQRKNMKIQDVSAFSNKIINTIIRLPQFIKCKNIMLYLSFNNEVDTLPLVTWCLNNSKTVIAPYCVQKTREIIPFEINDIKTDVTKSAFGIMEPKHDLLKMVNINDIDLIIVPGVLFDKHCNRIGFGAGYYDRFLSKKSKDAITIGIAYDNQIIDEIPADIYDVPLDFIVTQGRIIYPN
ncbi:MAG: 5-formyltetrahydrofolate cyclo-ligase [Clostridium sp.]|uniref:5-formyltetrahydrofolate cyclo-ligase n=1 Tax=Clostridium sp. TaxID=1506 RepID=UPI003D6D3802